MCIFYCDLSTYDPKIFIPLCFPLYFANFVPNLKWPNKRSKITINNFDIVYKKMPFIKSLILILILEEEFMVWLTILKNLLHFFMELKEDEHCSLNVSFIRIELPRFLYTFAPGLLEHHCSSIEFFRYKNRFLYQFSVSIFDFFQYFYSSRPSGINFGLPSDCNRVNEGLGMDFGNMNE